MVPEDFDTALGNREGNVAAVGEVGQAVAAFGQFDRRRAFLDDVVDRLRSAAGAVRLVYRDPVAVRIALEHRQLAGGQLVLVLRGVGRGDDELRFFRRERIAEEAIGIHRRGARFEAAGPGRDAAVGVAFLLRAQRGEGGAQLLRFLRRDGGDHAGGQQRQGQCASAHHGEGSHACVPPVLHQKFRPKLSAT
ncbi:hypothetical protein D3C78_1183180 [compost metagenome]